MQQDDILNDAMFEELLKASRAATKEDAQLADMLQTLTAHPGWAPYLNQVLGIRIQNIGVAILDPAGSTSGMVRTEFLKGAMYGLCLARDLPSVIIRSMRDVRSPQENADAT